MSRFCLLHPSHPGLSVAHCLSATQKTYNTVGSRLLRRRPRSLGVPFRLRSPKSYHPIRPDAANQATFPTKHCPTNAFTHCSHAPKHSSLAAGKSQDKAFHPQKKLGLPQRKGKSVAQMGPMQGSSGAEKQGLLKVCPSRSCPAVAPVVAFAGTAPASWIPSPPPRLLRQAI